MKKKIIAIAVAVLLLVTGLISGSIAYLTDVDDNVNVIVLGNVSINQYEMQRADDGSLEPFVQDQLLLPGYTNKGWARYDWGNAVTAVGAWNDLFACEYGVMDKFVFVENTGKADAYFRTIIAVESPAALTDDALRVNLNGHPLFDWSQDDGLQTGADNAEWIENVEIDGQVYDLLVATYTDPLVPGEIARPSFLQVALDVAATNKDMELLGETCEVLVATQAVQTYGFSSAASALKAAFGEISATNHPWLEGDLWDGTADVSWYNTNDTAFTIDSAEQLAGLAQIVAGTAVDENGNAIAQDSFSAKTVTLGSEINLAEKEWTPIGNEAYAFDGTFDGGEKTIRNLFVNNESYAGLFGKVGANGTVKNVSVENAVINTSAYGAAVVGYSYGDIDHCSAVDAVISSDDTAGAIVAFTPADSVTAVTNNCAEDVEIVAGCDAGIIAGRAPSGKCTLNGNTWSNVTVEFNGVLGNSGTNIAETEAGRTN